MFCTDKERETCECEKLGCEGCYYFYDKYKEEWRDIKGYEGQYQVSNQGRIKSFKLWTGSMYINNERILKNVIYKNGYENVMLKNKHFLVHRLVAKAFVPNPNNLPIINHKDGNKANNNANNLEWCNYSHNEKEAYRLELKKGCKKAIVQYDKKMNKIKEWESIAQANLQTKISRTNISECCLNKRKTAGGYVWKFKEEDKNV